MFGLSKPYRSKYTAAAIVIAGLFSSGVVGQPATPVRVVKEDFFGREIADPYRWLENVTDPEVLKWLKDQNGHTRSVLDQIPERARFLARMQELDDKTPPPVSSIARDDKGRLYFYQNNSAGVSVGYVLDPGTGSGRVVIDPEKLAGAGKPAWRVSGLSPSPDGKYIAFRVSGPGRSKVFILDSATGSLVGTPIENVLGFTGLDWDPDSKSLYVVKMPPLRPDMKRSDAFLNGAAYRHKIGEDPASDQLIMATGRTNGLALPVTSWPFVFPLPDKKNLAVWVEDGARTGHALYVASRSDVLAGKANWRKLADFDDGATHAVFHSHEAFIVTAGGDNGKRQILRMKVETEDFKAARKVELPKPDSVVTSMEAAADALYVTTTEGFSTAFYRIPYGGKAVKIEPPIAGAIKPFLVSPTAEGGLFRSVTWTRPSEIYRYHPKQGWRPAADLQTPPKLDGLDLVAKTVAVRSHDGVEVPLTIVHRRDIKLDSKNPTYLTGYGSYGSGSLEPSFDNVFVPWFEAGGIYALAHVRGGGELGEAWHKAGSRDKKQNTWLDFIACAEFLISRKYTSPDYLAGSGLSAGGILIGRAITERPDLFRAALISVGTTDMLRAEYQMNGPANVVEFGTVKDKTGFEQLFGMSAYHHVRNGVTYPSVMLSTGMKDPNVDVWQPAKMAARMQSVATAGRPVLLRVDPEAGHDQYGSTRAQVRELRTDQLAFLMWQFGLSKRN